jgi:CheY-like chemotaxis protein
MGTRILVVEDDAEIADSLVRGLGEEGYVVEHAADGEAARLAMYDLAWDIIILDWWLPGPDGLTLLRRYRQTGGESPVLFLTARVFQPFYRSPEARSRGQLGLGLGLAVAERIVAVFGGTIRVASEPGVGTHFAISLPETGSGTALPVVSHAEPRGNG